MIGRLSLSRLIADPHSLALVPESGPALAVADYSRFKHGDGALSAAYGTMLAEAFIPGLVSGEVQRLAVTSSAFGFAPPAAHSLLWPFLSRARQLARRRIAFTPFKVTRCAVSNGDYATMSAAERASALDGQPLSVNMSSDDLAGMPVVVLDDVRVTGAHEAWIETVLRRAGVAEVSHLYLVDAHGRRDEPCVEAALNSSGVRNLTDLVGLCHQEQFVPNARICKWVVSAAAEEQHEFVAYAPTWVTDWVLRAARLDGLEAYGAYRDGLARLESLASACPVPS